MRKGLILVVLLMLVFSLAATVGCGKKETTVKIGDEEITISEDDLKDLEDLANELESDLESDDDGNSTYTDDDTSITSNDKAPTEAELGVPIYPDAKYIAGSGGTASMSSEGETSLYSSGEFTSTDSFEKVVAWYTAKYGEPMMAAERDAIWMPGGGADVLRTVNVIDENGRVKISIANISNM